MRTTDHRGDQDDNEADTARNPGQPKRSRTQHGLHPAELASCLFLPRSSIQAPPTSPSASLLPPCPHAWAPWWAPGPRVAGGVEWPPERMSYKPRGSREPGRFPLRSAKWRVEGSCPSILNPAGSACSPCGETALPRASGCSGPDGRSSRARNQRGAGSVAPGGALPPRAVLSASQARPG